jgi:hypothetical protein
MFGEWGNPDHDESVRIIHAALDAGVNFIDTADVYSAGESEEITSWETGWANGAARPASDEGARLRPQAASLSPLLLVVYFCPRLAAQACGAASRGRGVFGC